MRVGLAAALVLLAVPALAQDVVYTGCIKSGDGTLYSVRAGTTPMAPCKAKDNQISWNMAGQPGPQGPPGPSYPKELQIDVNCDGGQSIQDALQQHAEKLLILFRGTCTGRVLITRDDVVLQGVAGTNPTITAGEWGTLEIIGGQRVILEGFAVRGAPLKASDASFSAYQLNISNAGGRGVDIGGGVSAYMQDSEISGNGSEGIMLSSGPSLYLSSVQIIDNGGLGIFAQNSTLTIQGTTVARNARAGVHLRNSDAQVRGWNCCNTILNNGGTGFYLEVGSDLFLEQGSIVGNGEAGILVTGTSAAFLGDVIVQNNIGYPVEVSGGSSVTLGADTRIDGGEGLSGILLRDTCTSNAGGSSITGFPYGIECEWPPSVSQIRGPVPDTVSTNCPHFE